MQASWRNGCKEVEADGTGTDDASCVQRGRQTPKGQFMLFNLNFLEGGGGGTEPPGWETEDNKQQPNHNDGGETHHAARLRWRDGGGMAWGGWCGGLLYHLGVGGHVGVFQGIDGAHYTVLTVVGGGLGRERRHSE